MRKINNGGNALQFDGAFSIYGRDIKNYRTDNRHIKEQRTAQENNRVKRIYEAMRAAKPFQTISLILSVLLVSHAVYA